MLSSRSRVQPTLSNSGCVSRFAASSARKMLADKLGDIKVEERDDGVSAQMDIGPVLLAAVGADVVGSGCGGALLFPGATQDSVAIPNQYRFVRIADLLSRSVGDKSAGHVQSIDHDDWPHTPCHGFE